MQMDAIIESMSAAIRQTLSEFGQKDNEADLTPERAYAMTQALIQAAKAAGVAGLRTFLESHEEASDTVEKDGVRYRYKFTSTKQFHTFFGVLELPRRLYQPDSGGASFVPLDAAWGMEGEYATPEVREACLFGLGLNTSEEVATLLEKCALFHPSASTIKRMAMEVQEWLGAHKSEVDAAIREQETAPAQANVLMGSLDGVNVLLAEPGKKKGRPTERPKTGQDDGKTSYRNAMVGSVCLYASGHAGNEAESGPVRLTSRYVAHMPEPYAPTVKREWEQELAHAACLLNEDAVKLLLLDGSRALWAYVEGQEQFEEYEKAVDFYHVMEHLSRAAEALFGKKSKRAQAWYQQYRTKLLEADEAVESVLRSMTYYRRRLHLSRSREQQIRAELTFFRYHKHRMPYASLRRRGLPIGNGVVEAACKSVVKQRLCRSGMRWSRPGGQSVLTLRAYIKSDRWNAFWQQYNRLRKSA